MPGGDAGRAQRKAEERGTDPGGDPVPCHSQAVSVHAGCRASRPEKPQCHHSLLLETPLACHPLTHLQEKRDATAKTTGPGRITDPTTGSLRLVHSEPHRPTWKFSLHPSRGSKKGTHTQTQMFFSFRTTTIGRRAISLRQQDIYGLWGVSGESGLSWVGQPL